MNKIYRLIKFMRVDNKKIYIMLIMKENKKFLQIAA